MIPGSVYYGIKSLIPELPGSNETDDSPASENLQSSSSKTID
jgi:hypothetical protein